MHKRPTSLAPPTGYHTNIRKITRMVAVMISVTLAIAHCVIASMQGTLLLQEKLQGDLVFKLDKSTIMLGHQARLKQTIENTCRIKVAQIDHHATLIATFNLKTGNMIGLDPVDYVRLAGKMDEYLGELSSGHAYYHGMIYDVQTLRRHGTEFEFTPVKPGVYLLSSIWIAKDGSEYSGTPVVLTVRPAVPAMK